MCVVTVTLKERFNLIGQSQYQKLIPHFDWLEKTVTSDFYCHFIIRKRFNRGENFYCLPPGAKTYKQSVNDAAISTKTNTERKLFQQSLKNGKKQHFILYCRYFYSEVEKEWSDLAIRLMQTLKTSKHCQKTKTP